MKLTERFKYFNPFWYFREIKTVNERILQVKESELSEYKERNPYQMFLDGCLVVVEVGIMYCFVYNVFVKYVGILKSILYVFGFGILYVLWLRFVEETTKSFKGK